MKTTHFTSANILAFRSEIETAISAIAKKHGLNYEVSKISYTDSDASVKATLLTDKAQQKEQNINGSLLESVGLKLGQTFIYRGDTLTIVGYNTRSHKKPIEMKDQNNRGLKASVELVKSLLR